MFCLIIVSIICVLLLCHAPYACDRTICSNCSVTTTCPCGVLHISPTSFAPLSFHSSFSCSPTCFCCSLIISSYPCIYIYIYIYAFSRRFYPKRLTLHSSYSFYILSALAFPGNRTHDLGVANAMLYQLSYRKVFVCIQFFSYLGPG